MEINKIGAIYTSGACDFIVWAPNRHRVNLLLGDREEQLSMEQMPGGYWKITAPAEPGARYRFRLDEDKSFPDPASRSQPDGVHGASCVVDPVQFQWKDERWQGMDVGDMIIYEIHTGTFSDQHNFAGIRGRLDYLKNIGINTIELMPVAAFDGTRNWGYDGVFPFAVQENYGGADELKNLVNEAHDRGIAVLLDVVYNHFGPEGNISHQFGPYSHASRLGNWGPVLNFDGAHSDGVRNFFIANALMWLDEFHLDGLRLDAVHAIEDRSAIHFMKELQDAVNDLEIRCGKKKMLIAEIDLNDPRYLHDPSIGGYGLDAQWNDEFHHTIHSLLTGETNGYYEDFGQMQQLEKTFRDVFVYDGNYSTHRKRRFGASTKGIAYDRFVVFAQNHDQTGNRPKGERLASLISFEAQKLAAALVLLSPFTPLLFMGEEYGETNPFLFFVDFGNPSLLAKVSQGRKEEFSYFNHPEEFIDPVAAESFTQTVLSWNYFSPRADALLRWHQRLISCRTQWPALRNKSRDSVRVRLLGEWVLLLERTNNSESCLIFFNCSKDRQFILHPGDKPLRLLEDSSRALWAGASGIDYPDQWTPGSRLEQAPESVLIYSVSS